MLIELKLIILLCHEFEGNHCMAVLLISLITHVLLPIVTEKVRNLSCHGLKSLKLRMLVQALDRPCSLPIQCVYATEALVTRAIGKRNCKPFNQVGISLTF